MSQCERYNPDNVFKNFKVVEFPISYVGLSTTKIIDVEFDLTRSVYLKTLCEGRLQKFEEAREISASHRAFEVTQIDNNTLQIKYHPKTECVSRAKRNNQTDNRFVFDLRLIQVNEARCCSKELHAEVGRYYISGQYEYCKVTHQPEIIDFGDVVMNEKQTKYVRMRNNSNFVTAYIHYEKQSSFCVLPERFILRPNSSIRLAISIKPPALKMPTTLTFKIRNLHREYHEEVATSAEDKNFITYIINTKIKISCNKKPTVVIVESLHKLQEPLSKYTYLDGELDIYNKRKADMINYLKVCKCLKCACTTKTATGKIIRGRDICYSNSSLNKKVDGKDFCKVFDEKLSIYDLFDILFLPFFIDFGRVALQTYGRHVVTIQNKSKYNITVRLCPDEFVVYSDKMLPSVLIQLKALSKSDVTVFCLGFVEGKFYGSFEYLIDNTYKMKHTYTLAVGNPTLMVTEKNLKFGMVTNESFVTSVPLRIYNYFNNTADFGWSDIHPETPFEIIPSLGSIPGQSCKICDIIYISKPTKTKTHEIEFLCSKKKVVAIELSIVTRKLSIKFLQPSVNFKEIPLNLEIVEKVKLENSSRELALFHVVEPLIPGFRIEPMSGTIRPKMIMTFDIIVKIPCILEFAFDVLVKINNKEVVVLPVSGTVVEPKIVIQPKNIFMPRIPCHLISYVPVTFQNFSTLKTEVQVLDTGDDNIFDVYTAHGNEKERVFYFVVEGGQSKTVYIKVTDIFRREYEMYIPFKINGLLGPPYNGLIGSTELQYYIRDYERYYDNNAKVKLKSLNKDISYCRIIGVITVPWLTFSVDHFEFVYAPGAKNTIEFTIKNVSKYYLSIIILTLKLAPNFTLELLNVDQESVINETQIKFDLDRGNEVAFSVKFHPRSHGRFVATATLFLDKHMTIPYSNLTFCGKRETPAMTPSTFRVLFPPCEVGTTITRIININFEAQSDLEQFSCISKEGSHIAVKFLDYQVKNSNTQVHTILTVELTLCNPEPASGNLRLLFKHSSESSCDVEVNYCVTYCSLTLHANCFVEPENNPFPFYPLSSHTDLYDYLENCVSFLEKWMFQQGFRRDLYPVIPDTFHAISSKSGKGINVSYVNFVRRIAGPLMKHVRKVSVHEVDDSFKHVKEVHDTYRGIINLLQSRGANLWALQATYLLSHEQFVIYADNVTPTCNADIVFTNMLVADVDLFNRLNKQSWIDFILQSYKVFIIDSCFFECICVTTKPRDIVKILIDWYNEHIQSQHNILLGKNKSLTLITNITTDLTDGVAIASVILSHCPFLNQHFSIFCEVTKENTEGDIINNACLIIEAINQLRLYFPLASTDFFKPNYLQMLFLSIHLYVVLPMFEPKETIILNPPLLRSSTRQVSICASSQEALIFSFLILNNNRNAFFVEKVPSTDNGKKMFLNVKYVANFVDDEECLLLVHGYNKTRIFDTYIMFVLQGHVDTLIPERKCKVTGPLYRPMKVDILVASPFQASAIFNIYITDVEPTVPVQFTELRKPQFYVRRLNLIDKEIYLYGTPKDAPADLQEHKLYLQIICLSTQIGNSWIWFTSEIGQFFVRVTTQPRWDLAIDTLQTRVQSWPMDPCSCGEACECYRTCILMVPHRNELALKALRYALIENASSSMINIFDEHIGTTTGKLIIAMLLEEGGTNMSELQHILRINMSYRITSRTLLPRLENVTLAQHTNQLLPLPVTIPVNDKVEKYAITLTSECGMEIRTYRVIFIEPDVPADNP